MQTEAGIEQVATELPFTAVAAHVASNGNNAQYIGHCKVASHSAACPVRQPKADNHQLGTPQSSDTPFLPFMHRLAIFNG
ncbi:hypothetical protein [Ruegeria meonggei]|uniref:hypothetical protein n=1 Tax=Ruegeria meonggei TaxID=1446476 RepID=UPI00366E5E07